MPSFYCSLSYLDLPSFPTRRSSDLHCRAVAPSSGRGLLVQHRLEEKLSSCYSQARKSTRLNSTHLGQSYALFLLLTVLLRSTLFPYTTLFRSPLSRCCPFQWQRSSGPTPARRNAIILLQSSSEEHTSELHSLRPIVCPLFIAHCPT